ncbi:hypothetical protein C8Q74DRAFT_898717 [Fomes fomentarius]|nr:hypothetical protein C8Q74DRAFT_898717 [Fomes fomentarius]
MRNLREMLSRSGSRIATSKALSSPALLAVGLWGMLAHAGNTTCISKQLDWYVEEIGESPCVTYQNLRQICNPDYQVPSFKLTAPGDQCDDLMTPCCCNTVAFALSMLCMNCQYDTVDGDSNGIDAAPGDIANT